MNTKATPRAGLPPLKLDLPTMPHATAAGDDALMKWSQQPPDAAAGTRASLTRAAYPWQEFESQETAQFLLRHLPKRTLKKLHYLKMMDGGGDTIWRIINDGIEIEADRRLLEIGIRQEDL